MTLIPRKILFGNPKKASCQLSPDGKWLTWLAPRNDVLNIWLASVDDLDNAQPITNDQNRGVRFHIWAPNMTHVLYLQDKDGDENWHLYSVHIDTKEQKNLTPYEKTTTQFHAMSWDQPDIAILGLNDRDDSWHDIYKVNLTTGDRELLFLNDKGFGDFTFDHYFNLRFAEKPIQDEGGRQIYRYVDGEFSEFMKVSHDDDLTTHLLDFE